MATQQELRESITNQIIQSLEKGVSPWKRPWSSDPCSGPPTNAVSGKPYTGVNPLVLNVVAENRGYKSKFWATYRQWEELGFQVIKRPDEIGRGSWGTTVVYCKAIRKSDDRHDDNDDSEKTVFMLRSFVVFNSEQATGDCIEKYRIGSSPVAATEIDERNDKAERVVEATGADIRITTGDRACYSITGDFIQMPEREKFSTSDWYEAIFHELTHWSEPRLNWDRKNPENTYALGELIAELSACYLAGELGLPLDNSLDNHAAYLKTWLDNMKADSRFLFRATAQASKASDFILSISRVAEPEELLV